MPVDTDPDQSDQSHDAIDPNTAFGSNTLNSNTSGTYNTGTYNTALGAYAGAKTNNSFNTYLGAQTDISGTTQISNSTAIGYNAQITASHQIVLGTISENISIPGPYVGIGTYNPTNALALDISGNVNVSNGNISGSILTPFTLIQNGGTITSNYAGGSVELLGSTATLFEATTFTGICQPTIRIFANNLSGSAIQCLTSNFIGNLGTQVPTLIIQPYSVATLVSDGTNWIITAQSDIRDININTQQNLANMTVNNQTNLNGPVNIGPAEYNSLTNTDTNTINIQNQTLSMIGQLSTNILNVNTISSLTSVTTTATNIPSDGQWYPISSTNALTGDNVPFAFNLPTPGTSVTALIIINSTYNATTNCVDANCAYLFMGIFTATQDTNNNITLNLTQMGPNPGIDCIYFNPSTTPTEYNSINIIGADTTSSTFMNGSTNYSLGQIGVQLGGGDNLDLTANIIYIG